MYTLSKLIEKAFVLAGQPATTPSNPEIEQCFDIAFDDLTSFCNMIVIDPIDYSLYPDRFLSLVSQLTAYYYINKGYQNVVSESLGSYKVTFESDDKSLLDIFKKARKFRIMRGYAPKDFGGGYY